MTKLFKRGLLALSADPITLGHVSLGRRALSRCEELVVLIANNDMKIGKYLFDLDERVAMARRAYREAGVNVEVIGSSGLLVDVYLNEACDALFRGIRNDEDRRYEETQMGLHCRILPQLKDHIVYLEAREEMKTVSSSMVKAFVAHGIDVSTAVPAFVKQALEEKICGQMKVAVTGCIAVGKTFVASEVVKLLNRRGIQASHINVDVLQRRLYEEDTRGAQLVRDRIAVLFGEDTLSADRKSVDRKVLAARLFAEDASDDARREIHELVTPHIDRLYRDELRGKKGLILVEWAQLAEMGMGYWTNNHVIVVDSHDRTKFAEKRGISAQRILELAVRQMSADEKEHRLERAAQRAKFGIVFRYSNPWRDEEADRRADLEVLIKELLETFPRISSFRKIFVGA